MGHFIFYTQAGSVLHLCAKFEADSSFPTKVTRSPKISKLVHVTQATPIWGSFYIPYAGGSVLHIRNKFEAIVQFVQKFGILLRDAGHAHL